MKIFIIFVFSITLTACALNEKRVDTVESDFSLREAQSLVIRGLSEAKPQVVEEVAEIPVVVNSAVKSWISYFSKPGVASTWKNTFTGPLATRS